MTFETDLPPHSRSTHPSGILHAFGRTAGSLCAAAEVEARSQGQGGMLEFNAARSAHTFAWVANSLYIESALTQLEKRGYDRAAGVVFIPYSTKRNWIERYPQAAPSLECIDDNTCIVYTNPWRTFLDTSTLADGVKDLEWGGFGPNLSSVGQQGIGENSIDASAANNNHGSTAYTNIVSAANNNISNKNSSTPKKRKRIRPSLPNSQEDENPTTLSHKSNALIDAKKIGKNGAEPFSQALLTVYKEGGFVGENILNCLIPVVYERNKSYVKYCLQLADYAANPADIVISCSKETDDEKRMEANKRIETACLEKMAELENLTAEEKEKKKPNFLGLGNRVRSYKQRILRATRSSKTPIEEPFITLKELQELEPRHTPTITVPINFSTEASKMKQEPVVKDGQDEMGSKNVDSFK
eukprot:CAMPEP_0183716514 /NCGR_PEP_ID=MMETSP0737-20130205/10407_1 /TAXON_ID=385413 /ORGANISM="Thalassiosira miniscula, Strain CCMP1093" /LENGTH=413 /DNA_ID=CAMNT_0025945803 /DNA_START=227 /DNA_END=1468 /DNA_ORIENTATION=+